MQQLTAFCVLLFTLIFGFYFLHVGKLGGASFTAFCGIVMICFIAFFAIDRLKELDLKNMKLVLTEMKETKKEIYAKADAVKRLGEEVAELVAHSVARENRFVGKDHQKGMLQRRDKILAVLDTIGTSEEKAQQIVTEIDRMVLHDLRSQLADRVADILRSQKRSEELIRDARNELLDLKVPKQETVTAVERRLKQAGIDNPSSIEEYRRIVRFVEAGTLP